MSQRSLKPKSIDQPNHALDMQAGLGYTAVIFQCHFHMGCSIKKKKERRKERKNKKTLKMIPHNDVIMTYKHILEEIIMC